MNIRVRTVNPHIHVGGLTFEPDPPAVWTPAERESIERWLRFRLADVTVRDAIAAAGTITVDPNQMEYT